jgi:probable phosphoglycerate mutase
MADHSAELPNAYLIRHGQTTWSLTGQHTGRTDLPLTPEGEQESRALGDRLRGTAFTHVLSSPLVRARRTCELAGLGGLMEIDPDLAEWDYGDYEGLRGDEIHQVRPDWQIFRDGCPHGEMPADVQARVDRLIARVRTWQGRIALCCHGHIGQAIAARWIDLRLEEARHFALGTASLSVLGYEHNRADEPAITLWNARAD